MPPPPTQIATRLRRAVAVVLGVVLLTAAGLKLAGQAISPVPAVGEFSSPRLGVAIAAGELLLGLALLTGWQRVLTWWLAVATFLTFAAVSGYLGLQGVANCGCFGAVKASPWAAFGVDVAALLFLAVARPRPFTLPTVTVNHAFSRPRLTIAFAALIVMCTAALAYYGTVAGALAALRGESVTFSASYLNFGTGAVGDTLAANITITNHAATPLRIVGGTSDCSCTTTESLPVTIASGTSADVPIQLRIPKSNAGQMTRHVILRTDSPDLPELKFRIGCIVR